MEGGGFMGLLSKEKCRVFCTFRENRMKLKWLYRYFSPISSLAPLVKNFRQSNFKLEKEAGILSRPFSAAGLFQLICYMFFPLERYR